MGEERKSIDLEMPSGFHPYAFISRYPRVLKRSRCCRVRYSEPCSWLLPKCDKLTRDAASRASRHWTLTKAFMNSEGDRVSNLLECWEPFITKVTTTSGEIQLSGQIETTLWRILYHHCCSPRRQPTQPWLDCSAIADHSCVAMISPGSTINDILCSQEFGARVFNDFTLS